MGIQLGVQHLRGHAALTTSMPLHGAGGLGVGAVTGNVGRGMATGAAGGASVGLVSGLLGSTQMDPVMRRWVEACLQERGYRVVGWQ